MKKLALIILAALGLSACAPHQLTSAMTGSARTIGVISAFGDEIHFARSGITVFGNAESSGDIASWHVDDAVLAAAKSALTSRYSVIVLKGDPELLKNAGERIGGPFDGRLSRALGQTIGSEKADIWITISGTCPNAGNYGGPLPCGVSVARPEAISGTPSAWATVYSRMTVYDGATLAPIAQTSLLNDQQGCYYLTTLSLFTESNLAGCNPAKELGPGYAVDSWDQYSSEQRAVIKQAITERLTPAVGFTLRQLKLVD